MRFELDHHLGVGEVGEDELAPGPKRLGAEPRPEIDEPILGMAVDPAEALLAGQLDPGLHHHEGEAAAPEFLTDREPLELDEVREEPRPDAGRRFRSRHADQMRRAKIVAVELLLIGADLIGHEHGGPNRRDLHQILERPGDLDVRVGYTRPRIASVLVVPIA